jgi:hypothetical protein
MSDLKYIYLPGMPDAPIGYEAGMLLWMDMHPEVEWARDVSGKFGITTHRLLEDGTYDISYSARVVNALVKKGWVEVVAWTERMAPARVRRTAKPGIPADQ